MSNGELECITYVEENNKKEDNDNSNENKNNENNNSNKNNHESNENKVINSDISKINKSAAEAIQPVKKEDKDCDNLFHKVISEPIKQKEDNSNLLKKLSGGLGGGEIDNKNTIKIKENNKDSDNNDNSDYEGEFINDKKNENEKENEKKEDNKYNNEIQENVIKKDIKKDNSINILNSNKEKKYVEDESELKLSRLSDMEHYSYLNAILVCLGNIEQLKKYFLDKKIREAIYESLNNKRLSFAFQRLLEHLYKKTEIYKPDKILRVLREKNCVFKNKFEINPNICINYILNQIHDELNSGKNNQDYQKPNPNDTNDVIQKGKTNFELNNNSIIKDVFSWYEFEKIRCNKCKNPTFRFHSFFTFDLDISYIEKEMKRNKLDIYDCIEYYQKRNISNIYCYNCREFNAAESSKSIINSPKNFIFLIDRGNFDKNLCDVNFNLDEEIDLKKFMDYNKDSPTKYHLKAIVSIFENKYISFVKYDKDYWNIFNDTKISEAKNNDVIRVNSSSGIKHIPCILFYELIGSNENKNN